MLFLTKTNTITATDLKLCNYRAKVRIDLKRESVILLEIKMVDEESEIYHGS